MNSACNLRHSHPLTDPNLDKEATVPVFNVVNINHL